jgi:hypothetical protein
MKTGSSFLPAAPPAALISSIARLIALVCDSLRPASGIDQQGADLDRVVGVSRAQHCHRGNQCADARPP